MNIIKIFLLFFSIIFLAGCSSNPELKDVNLHAWQKDKNGCKGERENEFKSLFNQRDKLLGLRQAEVIKLLGQPDKNLITNRNKKYYYYYVDPNSECNYGGEPARMLAVEFGSIDNVRSVSVQKF